MSEPLLEDELAPAVTQHQVQEAKPKPEKRIKLKIAKPKSVATTEKDVPSSDHGFLVQVRCKTAHCCPRNICQHIFDDVIF